MPVVEIAMKKKEQIKITILLFGFLQESVGKKRLKVIGRTTVLETLAEIRKQYPSLREKMDIAAYVILLNGINLLGKDLGQVTLRDGDIITFVPFAAGG